MNLNKLVIESDTKCGCWCHHIGWIALEIGATSPVFMLHGAGQSNAFWDPPEPGEAGGATIDDALRSEYFVVNTELNQPEKTVDEAADLIVEALQATIESEVVTYDFARLMEGVKEVKLLESWVGCLAAKRFSWLRRLASAMPPRPPPDWKRRSRREGG